MSMPPDPNATSKIERIANSSTFILIGRGAAIASLAIVAWLLGATVNYGQTLATLNERTANQTEKISALTTQLQAETAARYTKDEAAKDFAYRDKQIDGLQTHLINAEHDIDVLKSDVAKGGRR